MTLNNTQKRKELEFLKELQALCRKHEIWLTSSVNGTGLNMYLAGVHPQTQLMGVYENEISVKREKTIKTSRL